MLRDVTAKDAPSAVYTDSNTSAAFPPVWLAPAALIVGLILTVSAVAGASRHLQPNPRAIASTFVASPTDLTYGETALLAWSVESPTGVFISELGRRPARGSELVVPSRTTTYYLVGDADGRVQISSVTVHVRDGARGIEFAPTRDGFRYPITGTLPSTSSVQTLDWIRLALQDKLHFSVRGPTLEAGSLVFETNLSDRPNLVRPHERVLAMRRASTLLIVRERTPSDSQTTFVIQSFIQYRRRAESIWRTEQNEDVYRLHSTELRAVIEALAAR